MSRNENVYRIVELINTAIAHGHKYALGFIVGFGCGWLAYWYIGA